MTFSSSPNRWDLSKFIRHFRDKNMLEFRVGRADSDLARADNSGCLQRDMLESSGTLV